MPSISGSLFSVLNALGIIAFPFRGHNLVLEIQWTTIPSTFKHPAHVPMWRGAKVAYFFIALCIFPISIKGFWAYGNLISSIYSNIQLEVCWLLYMHSTFTTFLLATAFLLVVFTA
ncbi:Lysine histidine transporter-like 8 [Raphanus sativus]|nr:Lysine histidine transporter-like 8 [Raphanus sativus]